MKNLILILTIATASITFLSFTTGTGYEMPSDKVGLPAYDVPDDVQEIIDNSCYGCHNTDSKSTKGKMKLNFDKLSDLKQSKQIGKLMKISKVVKNGKMPTKKFVEKYPDKKLTDDETTLLVTWADNMAVELSGE